MCDFKFSGKMEIFPKCLDLRISLQKEKREKIQLQGEHLSKEKQDLLTKTEQPKMPPGAPTSLLGKT